MTTAIEIQHSTAIEAIKQDLAEIEEYVESFSLADAMRAGSKHTNQLRQGWHNESGVCALSAAYLACRARDIV